MWREKSTKRKVNKYFITIPVSSWRIAKLFGSETNWKILETLRNVGVNGLSAEEISKKINRPSSTVYSVLSKLEAADWVESSARKPRWGRPTLKSKYYHGGKPARIFIENVPWGSAEFHEPFIHSFGRVLDDLEKDKEELEKKWFSTLEKIILAYQTDELKEFFPGDEIHDDEECGWSHEALEFLYAVSLALLQEMLGDQDFDELGKKHHFMK